MEDAENPTISSAARRNPPQACRHPGMSSEGIIARNSPGFAGRQVAQRSKRGKPQYLPSSSISVHTGQAAWKSCR